MSVARLQSFNLLCLPTTSREASHTAASMTQSSWCSTLLALPLIPSLHRRLHRRSQLPSTIAPPRKSAFLRSSGRSRLRRAVPSIWRAATDHGIYGQPPASLAAQHAHEHSRLDLPSTACCARRSSAFRRASMFGRSRSIGRHISQELCRFRSKSSTRGYESCRDKARSSRTAVARIARLRRRLFARCARMVTQPGISWTGCRNGSPLATASVTQSIEGLERSGLIGRHPDPDDQRCKLVLLTPKGHATLTTGMETGQRVLRSIFGALEPGRQADLDILLTDIKAAQTEISAGLPR